LLLANSSAAGGELPATTLLLAEAGFALAAKRIFN
jgi:hypothetical protein